nr:hypothetical protein [Tanacetum cinerariifolium]
MSADSAVTYTSVHCKARSWSIPSEDPYEEAAQQLLEQAPCSPEYVPDPIELEDHVPAYILEHPEDLVPAEEEAPIEAYIPEVDFTPTPPLPPSFLSLRIRPPHTRAAIAQKRDAVPSTYHSLLPSGTPPLLPIPLPVPSTSRRDEIPEADTPPRKRLLLTTPRPGYTMETRFRDTEKRMMTALEMVNTRVSYQVDVRSKESLEFYSRHHDAQKDRGVVRAEIEKMAPKRTTRSTQVPPITPAPTATTTTVTEAQLQALIDQGVAAAMADAEASRVRNGYESNGSGPSLSQAVRECTYPDFLKCQPLNFKGTEGVVGLTQWFEKIESVFNISNCTIACQVKYAACTLELTRVNSVITELTRLSGLDRLQSNQLRSVIKSYTRSVVRFKSRSIHIECSNTPPDSYSAASSFAGVTNMVTYVTGIKRSLRYHEIHPPSQEISDEVFQDNHSFQYKENLENSLNPNQEKEEPPQDSDIHQLIEECSTEICEEQKQSMKDTMLELVKICQEKEFLCIHVNVEDLIESALNSKLLLINSNSQRLDKKEQEVKNVVEHPAERGNHKPEYSSSMGYEHLSITPETESDEVTESNAKNLLPIPIYDDDFKDIEYIKASLSDQEIISIEDENVVQQEEEEVDLEDISQIQDVVLREKLLSITRLISNIESLNDNFTPDHVLNSFESDNSLSDTFSPEFETFCDHTEETRSGNTAHADNSLSEYDSFYFEIEPDQERLINLVKNDISDDSSNDPLLEEADLFLASDNSIPPGIENDNPSIPRPPPEPPDTEFDAGEEIPVVMNDKDEDVDYSSFIFIIFDKVFSLLSVESEDTIFDPGISA